MPLKVYYLDDEEDLCDCFTDSYASEEIEIHTFTNPERALEKARDCPPDLVFVDYRLPGTTGDAVARNMDPNVPKYLVTGDIAVSSSYTFVEVVQKPVSREKMLEILERHRKK